MIYNLKCATIVMLCELVENNQVSNYSSVPVTKWRMYNYRGYVLHTGLVVK